MGTVSPPSRLDIAGKRQVLFSARVRFTPHTQPVREAAIERIIEQNLLLAGPEGITSREISRTGALNVFNGNPVIMPKELDSGLRRLLARSRITEIKGSDGERYAVAPDAELELWAVADESERRIRRIVDRLFSAYAQQTQDFIEPFLHCLCLIFARLGEAYVRHLKGDLQGDELLTYPMFPHAISDTVSRFKWLDNDSFTAAITRFFEENDPDFAALKWNLGQNHYVAKALGLDDSGKLLSAEIFGNAEFYLDTNVLVDALEPSAKHHTTLQALAKACQALGIQLFTCQISLDELRRRVAAEREALRKVINSIPLELVDRIRGILYPAYRARLLRDGSADTEEIFRIFDEPMQQLQQQYGIQRIDDAWFVRAADHPDTERIGDELRDLYSKRTARKKTKGAAQHDALLLRWLDHERQAHPNAYLVTLDLSLPVYASKAQSVKARAISLDALLQWMSPVALCEAAEETEVAEIFSEALKQHLLPQEIFFELSDFLVFAEMEWATKELPAEDVENCIRAIKSSAPSLDVNNPSDREQIAHKINKFFADPGRKFKQELEQRETAMQELQQRLAISERDKAETVDGLKQQLQQQQAKSNADAAAQAIVLNGERLINSAILRLLATSTIAIVAIILIALAADKFAQGHDWVEKVLSWWPFLVALLGTYVIVTGVVLGKARLQALGWPFSM